VNTKEEGDMNEIVSSEFIVMRLCVNGKGYFVSIDNAHSVSWGIFYFLNTRQYDL
jgi:hypothetical protein